MKLILRFAHLDRLFRAIDQADRGADAYLRLRPAGWYPPASPLSGSGWFTPATRALTDLPGLEETVVVAGSEPRIAA